MSRHDPVTRPAKFAPSRTTLVLGLGFALVLAMLSGVVAIGVLQLAQASRSLDAVVNQHNHKLALSQQLFRYARERVQVLQRMFIIDDPFERDTLARDLDALAAQFVATREALRANPTLPLNAREEQLLGGLSGFALRAVKAQRRVSDLILDGEVEAAREVMIREVFPAQTDVLAVLEELGGLQRQASRAALDESQRQQRVARLAILSLGVGAVLFGLLIAALSVRRTLRTEAALAYERERALVSLHALADGVITTTGDGRIDYLNPLAQRLTGWNPSDARGRPLLEVLRLVDEERRQPVAHNLSELLAANPEQRDLVDRRLLQRRDGQELHVEHSVARIGLGGESFGGVVVVLRDVSEMVALARKLSHQVRHDPLTGLLNRREFEHQLERALDGARQHDKHHMLLYLDLDRFKVVNDTCGHAAGDELLRQVSSLLRAQVRDSDRVARLGGDEFGVLLESCPEGRAMAIAEAMRGALEQLVFTWEGHRFTIGTSIGLAPIDARSGDLGDLIASADAACYMAKNAGRNRLHLHAAGDPGRGDGGLLIGLVREALRGEGFQLHCQRVKPLQADAFHPPMCEVLLRLSDNHGRELLPMAFIPTVERYGLMPEVDLWVLERMLYELNRMEHWSQGTLVALNLAGQSLAALDFLPRLRNLLVRYPRESARLCFEINESCALTYSSQLQVLCDALHNLGARVAFDDFGHGLQSFDLLQRMGIDFVKLDPSLTRHLLDTPMHQARVHMVVELCHQLDICCVAKYVEDPASEGLLTELGVDYVQGYLVDRPQPLHFR